MNRGAVAKIVEASEDRREDGRTIDAAALRSHRRQRLQGKADVGGTEVENLHLRVNLVIPEPDRIAGLGHVKIRNIVAIDDLHEAEIIVALRIRVLGWRIVLSNETERRGIETARHAKHL